MFTAGNNISVADYTHLLNVNNRYTDLLRTQLVHRIVGKKCKFCNQQTKAIGRKACHKCGVANIVKLIAIENRPDPVCKWLVDMHQRLLQALSDMEIIKNAINKQLSTDLANCSAKYPEKFSEQNRSNLSDSEIWDFLGKEIDIDQYLELINTEGWYTNMSSENPFSGLAVFADYLDSSVLVDSVYDINFKEVDQLLEFSTMVKEISSVKFKPHKVYNRLIELKQWMDWEADNIIMKMYLAAIAARDTPQNVEYALANFGPSTTNFSKLVERCETFKDYPIPNIEPHIFLKPESEGFVNDSLTKQYVWTKPVKFDKNTYYNVVGKKAAEAAETEILNKQPSVCTELVEFADIVIVRPVVHVVKTVVSICKRICSWFF